MKKDIHHISRLMKLVNREGLKVLLPQNMTEEIFLRMIEEVEAQDESRTDDVPSSTIFLAVMQLSEKKVFDEKSVKIKISEEKIMDNFSSYVAALRIEAMRRDGVIEIAEDLLPTEDNIFKIKRMKDILLSLKV